MLDRSSFGALALAMALTAPAPARADDTSKYPDLKGWWLRVDTGHGASWDPSKFAGLRQQAPLTPEYQAILEVSLADQAKGGQGNNSMAECTQPGMPRTMTDYEGMEFIVTPQTTYIALVEPVNHLRRIFTDGRDWPAKVTPTLLGYSIGKWRDEDGDGRYDVLEVETRHFRGPREFESSGLPLHADNQSTIKERIYFDQADPNILHDEITTFDHALTRPWTVLKGYRRARKPAWSENICGEDNHHVFLGQENYYISMDGHLMPTRKDQPPPDLRYFEPTRK
jgi:hypothetical protein